MTVASAFGSTAVQNALNADIAALLAAGGTGTTISAPKLTASGISEDFLCTALRE